MTYRVLLFFCFCSIFSFFSVDPGTGLISAGRAQEGFLSGARAAGLGGAAVALSEVWAVENNPAGLGSLRQISAGAAYQNLFMMKELSTRAGAAALPVRAGTFGLSVSNFGYSAFSRNKIGFGFGKSFGRKISAGVTLDYFSTAIPEYGKRNSLVAEAGLQVFPYKNLTVGMHLFNPAGIRPASGGSPEFSPVMRLGLAYTISGKVLAAAETQKDLDSKNTLKAGIEYRPVKELYLRMGMTTGPALSCFGVGLCLKQFRLDISSSYHPVLGVSSQVGLMYQFAGQEGGFKDRNSE